MKKLNFYILGAVGFFLINFSFLSGQGSFQKDDLYFNQRPSTIEFNFDQASSFKGYAKVDERLGYEIYCLAEPVRKYKEMCAVTVGEMTVKVPDKKSEIDLKPIRQQRSITDKISHLAALVKKEDPDGDVQAIIYTGGQVAKGIMFTDEPTFETNRIAKVWNESGIDLYVLSTPLYDNNYLKMKNKWSFDALKKRGGLFSKNLDFLKEDSTIESDVYGILRLIAKGNRKKWPDGLIIDASGFIQGFDYKRIK